MSEESKSGLSLLMMDKVIKAAEIFIHEKNDSIYVSAWLAGEPLNEGFKKVVFKDSTSLLGKYELIDIDFSGDNLKLNYDNGPIKFLKTQDEEDIERYKSLKVLKTSSEQKKELLGWRYSEIVDEFGDDTGSKGIVGLFEGRFDNTMNTREDLLVKVGIQARYLYIELFEYERSRARLPDKEFIYLKLKDASGKISMLKFFIFENSLSDSKGQLIDYILSQSEPFGVLVDIGTVSDYDKSTYNFKIDPSGLKELLGSENEPLFTHKRSNSNRDYTVEEFFEAEEKPKDTRTPKELFNEAKALYKNKDYEEAIRLLQIIKNDYGSSPQAKQVSGIIDKIKGKLESK